MLARKGTRKYCLALTHCCHFCTRTPAKMDDYEVVVVGGGHAGCESVTAAARRGAKTLLITQMKEKIGEMSCNPSFGGIGKGHLMREIDAMDGVCGRICDQTGIHFHVLNRRHGPAVMGLRALIDRKLYKKAMQNEILNNTPNLDVIESTVEDICFEESTFTSDDGARTNCLTGCILADGRRISTPTLVLTTGTFLNGMLHWGHKQIPGGRIGEMASTGLASTFTRLGFKTGRLSTGTPPRILANTIDYSKFEKQPTDSEPIPFSFLNKTVGIPTSRHVSSYVGYTNEQVVRIVNENIDEKHTLVSALDEGIKGPRYCPSLEAKCMRFSNLRHRLFLEPEGLDSDLVYPQGCALGFELEVQEKIMRAIDGLENAKITQAGYSVRYNFVDPRQLHPTLETKRIAGLFLAGQINGTTGYEEAAAQGLVAGTNAAIRAWAVVRGEEYRPLVVSASNAYIGVMIEDLINFGVTEPYRIFTSRSENRLQLRPDNADMRLTEEARNHGIVSDARWEHFQKTLKRVETLSERLEALKFSPVGWNSQIPGLNTPGKTGNVYNAKKLMLKHPELRLETLARTWPQLFSEFVDDRFLEERIRNAARYAHLEREMQERLKGLEKEMDAKLPADLDYLNMDQLKLEMRERLHEHKPRSLAAATRIPGVNDTILFQLLRHAKRRNTDIEDNNETTEGIERRQNY